MKEFIEKLIGRLEEWKNLYVDEMTEIINQVAEEYNNDWIPCDKEVPKVNLRVLLSLKNGDVLMGSFDGDKYDLIGLGYVTMNSVLAWQPLPHKYEPKGE